MISPFGYPTNPKCEKCHGVGMFQDEDKMHGYPCDLCCPHEEYSILKGGIYGKQEGMQACRLCGKIKGTPENDRLIALHTQIINESDEKPVDAKILSAGYLIKKCRYCEQMIVIDGMYTDPICNKLSCFRARYRDIPKMLD